MKDKATAYIHNGFRLYFDNTEMSARTYKLCGRSICSVYLSTVSNSQRRHARKR